MSKFNEIEKAYETKIVPDDVDKDKNDIIDLNEVPILKEKLNNSRDKLKALNASMKNELIPLLQEIFGDDAQAAQELIKKVKQTIKNIDQHLSGNNNTENGSNNHGNQQGENHNPGNNPKHSPYQNQDIGAIPEGIQFTTNIDKKTGTTNTNIAYGNTTNKGNKFFSTVGVGTQNINTGGETPSISGGNTSGTGARKFGSMNFSAGVNTSGNTKKQKAKIDRQGDIDKEKLKIGDEVKDTARDIELGELGELQGKITKLTIKLKAAKKSLKKFEEKNKKQIADITEEWLDSKEGKKYLDLSVKVDEIQGTIDATKMLLQSKKTGN